MVEYGRLIPVLVKRGEVTALKDAFSLCRELEKEGSSTVIGGGEHGADKVIFKQENFDAAHRYVKAGHTHSVLQDASLRCPL